MIQISSKIKALSMLLLLFLLSKETFATITISGPVTWTSSNSPATDDILIVAGGTLTIATGATIDMRSYHIMVESYYTGTVKPGGKLIVNTGATLESTASGGWYGICVLGNTGFTGSGNSYSQQDSKMARAIFNSATVRDAKIGVCNFYGPYALSLGGFSSTNANGGIIQATNTTFTHNGIDVDFADYQNYVKINPSRLVGDFSYFQQCTFSNCGGQTAPDRIHANIHNMARIGFYGCTFSEPSWVGTTDPIVNGIRCDGAQVYVGDYSTFYTTTHSTFSNLKYAVYGDGQATGRSVTVNDATFTNCYDGAWLSGYNNCDIENNTFNIVPSYSGSTSVGAIQLSGSTGFTIQFNTINDASSHTTGDLTFGINITNSGENNNIVNSNTVSNMEVNLQADGNNKILSGTNAGQGLYFFCNTMSNSVSSAYDITVTTVNGTSGIAHDQYNAAGTGSSAEDYFSSGITSGYNYANNGPTIIYEYDASNSSTNPTYTKGVTKSSNSTNSCLYCSNNWGDPNWYPCSYMSYPAFVTNLVTLESSLSTASGTTYNNLMTKYNVLVNRMLNRYLTTADTTRDTINGNGPTDSMVAVLSATHYNYMYQVQLAMLQVDKGLYSTAMTTLTNISYSSTYSIDVPTSNMISDLIAIVGVASDLNSVGGVWSSLTSGDVSTINSIASSDNTYAGYIARYYRTRYEGASYTPDWVDPETVTFKMDLNNGNEIVNTPVKLYPNPAGDKVNIAGLQGLSADITITDLTGKIISIQHLAEGIIGIDISNLAPGMYLVKAKDEIGEIYNLKLNKQ